MSIFAYFAPSILLVLGSASLFHCSARLWVPARWATFSTSRWLLVWSSIGCAVPALLLTLSWASIVTFSNWTVWFWPFSIGLMALEGRPTKLETLLVLSITTFQNAVLYCLVAAVVRLLFSNLPRLRRTRKEALSIPGK